MSRSQSHETGYDVTPAEAFGVLDRLASEATALDRVELTQHRRWHDPWADGTRVYDFVTGEPDVRHPVAGATGKSKAVRT